jgi:OOP family OmpA-OmpF porin
MKVTLKSTVLATAICSSALLASSAVFADEAYENAVGWFVGGGLYYGDLDARVDIDRDDFQEDSRVSFNTSSASFEIQGGYRFNKWLSADAGYWDLGNYKSDRDNDTGEREKFDATAWTVGGMVSVPLWIMDFYARGGAAFWDWDGRNVDADGTDPYFGLGAAFNLGGSLDLYAEWIRFDQDADIDTFGLGARWTF